MTAALPVVFVAWRSPRSGAIHPILRVVDLEQDDTYEIAYVAGVAEAEQDGFRPLPWMKNTQEVYRFRGMPPFLKNRLMSPRRPDYPDHLSRLALNRDAAPFLILARTAGRRQTDTIEVFAPPAYDIERRMVTYFFFSRGIRHYDGADEAAAGLRPGSKLEWRKDDSNSWDQRAIEMTTTAGDRIGYVPGTLLDDFHHLLELGADLQIFVEKINLRPAPIQQRLLCRLEATDVGDFRPFDSVRYRPLSPAARLINFELDELVGN